MWPIMRLGFIAVTCIRDFISGILSSAKIWAQYIYILYILFGSCTNEDGIYRNVHR